MYSDKMILDDGKYNASWYYNGETDSLTFTVEVEATGWVGFGFAETAPTNMQGYDVGIGGVLNGTGYLMVSEAKHLFHFSF